jgi:hypothetical protein
MKKNHSFILLLLTVFLTVGLITGCRGGGNESDEGGIDPGEGPSSDLNFSVTADGNPTQSTTILNFSFTQAVSGFSEDNITLSGVSGVEKGILSAGTIEYGQYKYILPISGFRQGGSLSVNVEISGRRGRREVQIYYNSPRDGIYLGIIKFAGDAEAINLDNYSTSSNSDSPVLLDSSSRDQINNSFDNGYRIAPQPGTAIYYAVHKALANLKSSESRLPDNPDSVYLITFTDGLDNASAGQSRLSPIENKPFDTTADYVTFVKSEIASRKINGKGITAYSIGVKGSDVTDNSGFTTSLQNIATSPDKSKELTNFSDVQSTFDEIAEGLIQGSNFTLTTTLLDSGTKVRMTFDITSSNPTSADAAASVKYIEGTVIASGNNYTFTNITYGEGISSDAGTGPITGTISGTTVKFLFRNITGYNYSADGYKTKQWLWNSGTSSWQINSEYTTEKADFGNTVIYLVLDCSTSMSWENINNIRLYVKSFIQKIYNARYGGY